MRTVHKYVWNQQTDQMRVPLGKVVAVGWQNSQLCVWLEVQLPSTDLREMVPESQEWAPITVYGTGLRIPDTKDLVHLGSAVGSYLVFHVYGPSALRNTDG
jgi:hypothetical protein